VKKLALLLLAVALIAAPFFLKPYGIYLLSLWVVMTIAAIGLNLTLGYAGQISLAQGSFVGIGAYAAALLTTTGWPLWSAFLLAIALSLAIGWVLGYPALRVQHHYLAFVTLAFATLVFLVLRNEEWLTKGVYGISGIPRPTLLGWSARPGRVLFLLPGDPRARFRRDLVAGALAVGACLHRAARETRSAPTRSASTRGATR
jgi:branched-chain amino acid transport system permease protein